MVLSGLWHSVPGQCGVIDIGTSLISSLIFLSDNYDNCGRTPKSYAFLVLYITYGGAEMYFVIYNKPTFSNFNAQKPRDFISSLDTQNGDRSPRFEVKIRWFDIFTRDLQIAD